MKNTKAIAKAIAERIPSAYRNNAEEIIICMFLADCTIAETAKRINKTENYVKTVYSIVRNFGMVHSRFEIA